MINHEVGRGDGRAENASFLALTGRSGLPHGSSHERSPRHLQHLPRDYPL